jgi:ATP-dependent Clp protease ATP-binding subunit ClpA
VFERFTDRARRVVVLSQEEARLLEHNYIGSEHVLLGLLKEDKGIAARALGDQGLDLAAARDHVVAIVGRGLVAPSGHIPFTPRAKRSLEHGLREALQLGHDHIGDEHILLGLLSIDGGVAHEVLARAGIDEGALRERVGELLKIDPETLERTRAPRETSPRREVVRATPCAHPDDAIEISAKQGFCTVRCSRCGTLVGVLPNLGEAS